MTRVAGRVFVVRRLCECERGCVTGIPCGELSLVGFDVNGKSATEFASVLRRCPSGCSAFGNEVVSVRGALHYVPLRGTPVEMTGVVSVIFAPIIALAFWRSRS